LRRPSIYCTAGGSSPLVWGPAVAGRVGTAQRLGWRLLSRPPSGLWARPWYLNSLCFPPARSCFDVGTSDRARCRRERRNRRANGTDRAVRARQEARRRLPERAGAVGLPRSRAAGCQPTANQRRRASTLGRLANEAFCACGPSGRRGHVSASLGRHGPTVAALRQRRVIASRKASRSGHEPADRTRPRSCISSSIDSISSTRSRGTSPNRASRNATMLLRAVSRAVR